MDVLADDIVDLHHQIHIRGCFSFFLQFAVDGGNCLISRAHFWCNIPAIGIFHQPNELSGVSLEGFLFLNSGGYRIGRRLNQL